MNFSIMRILLSFAVGIVVGAILMMEWGGKVSMLTSSEVSEVSDFVQGYHDLQTLKIIPVEGEELEFEVMIADNKEERITGLQEVRYLKDNQGMWFIFDKEDVKTFWMKDMLISLDMLFVNSNFEVVSINKAAAPCFEIDPTQQYCEHYSSVEPVQYVLEIKAGMVNKFGLGIGDKISIQ